MLPAWGGEGDGARGVGIVLPLCEGNSWIVPGVDGPAAGTRTNEVDDEVLSQIYEIRSAHKEFKNVVYAL